MTAAAARSTITVACWIRLADSAAVRPAAAGARRARSAAARAGRPVGLEGALEIGVRIGRPVAGRARRVPPPIVAAAWSFALARAVTSGSIPTRAAAAARCAWAFEMLAERASSRTLFIAATSSVTRGPRSVVAGQAWRAATSSSKRNEVSIAETRKLATAASAATNGFAVSGSLMSPTSADS